MEAFDTFILVEDGRQYLNFEVSNPLSGELQEYLNSLYENFKPTNRQKWKEKNLNEWNAKRDTQQKAIICYPTINFLKSDGMKLLQKRTI
jgi:hypothetical protein